MVPSGGGGGSGSRDPVFLRGDESINTVNRPCDRCPVLPSPSTGQTSPTTPQPGKVHSAQVGASTDSGMLFHKCNLQSCKFSVMKNLRFFFLFFFFKGLGHHRVTETSPLPVSQAQEVEAGPAGLLQTIPASVAFFTLCEKSSSLTGAEGKESSVVRSVPHG